MRERVAVISDIHANLPAEQVACEVRVAGLPEEFAEKLLIAA